MIIKAGTVTILMASIFSGASIEFLVSADLFYAQRVDDLVTIYYSQETGEIIGSLIKGVSAFCKE